MTSRSKAHYRNSKVEIDRLNKLLIHSLLYICYLILLVLCLCHLVLDNPIINDELMINHTQNRRILRFAIRRPAHMQRAYRTEIQSTLYSVVLPARLYASA